MEGIFTDYLPEYDTTLLKNMTIRHLLTHTHGLSTDKIGQLHRDFPPGSGWAYNNTGIQLLERIIRLVTGHTVEQIIQERVC